MKRDAAIAELKQWEAKIRGGEISFEDAARQRSDCGSFAAVSFHFSPMLFAPSFALWRCKF